MLKLFKYIYSKAGANKGKIVSAILSQFVENTLSFVPLGMVLLFFQNLLNNTLTLNFSLVALLIMLLGVILRSFARYSMDKNSYSTMTAIFYDEKIKVTDHLKKINMGFFTDDNTGKVSSILINGMAFIEEKFMVTLVNVLAAIASLGVIGVVLFVMDYGLAIIYLVTVLVVMLILIPYQKIFKKHAAHDHRANEILTSGIIEYVKNISVIKAFHLLGKHKRSNDAFLERKRVDIDGEKVNIPSLLGSMSIMAVSTGGMIYYVLTQYQSLPLYTIITLSIMSMYVYAGLTTIILSVGSIIKAWDTLNNIEKLYDEKTLLTRDDKKPNGFDIEFNNVEFAYEKNNVIDNISFTLNENTMNALVGLSGSGKSTLVNLIPRFFEIQKGSIRIGGIDIRDMSQETLYSCISMVFQNVYLFNDTIYNNIAFGNQDATKEQVIQASKKAKCYDFITALPEGFDTIIGEAGLNLSGGERQRISIARAILKDSPIILLDEATASVDADNERDIQLAINELVKEKTILVIAHKLACVKNADKILVIDKGKLVAQGTHEDLIKEEGLYKTLCQKRAESKAWIIESNI